MTVTEMATTGLTKLALAEVISTGTESAVFTAHSLVLGAFTTRRTTVTMIAPRTTLRITQRYCAGVVIGCLLD